ncbi:MAG: DUF3365 domain-containing protein [Planctomycetales bacterium]|nr:DUF3365 domain-containing protein [Planctomycetales bacterium]
MTCPIPHGIDFGPRMLTRIGLVIWLGASIVVGCSQQPDSPATPSPPAASADLSATLVADKSPTDAEKKELLAAKDALFTQLSGRLMQAVGQGGPANAISVCSNEARSIAASVGSEMNVRIGRTGVRLRNPENQPPTWAETLCADQTAEPVFGVLTDSRAVALLPIRLQSQCLACHGPEASLDASVKEQLATLYPNDAATGFRDGELRGWFWIETLP